MTFRSRFQATHQSGPYSEHQELVVRGHRLQYEVAGAGEPLVLIHGLSGSGRWWWRNLPELTQSYRVFVVDLPAFQTQTPGPPRSLTLSEAASFLGEWMDAADIERAHVVGHSLGGFVSLHLAASFPERVRRLVLVAPAGVRTDRGLAGYSLPLLKAAGQLRPRFAAVLARDFIRTGPFTVLNTARALLSEEIRPDLERVNQPVLLIWGADDPMVPPTIGTVLRSAIEHSRLLVIENAGHVPMVDRPREFNNAVLDFLGGEEVGT